MAPIWQTTFSSAFSYVEIILFRIKWTEIFFGQGAMPLCESLMAYITDAYLRPSDSIIQKR